MNEEVREHYENGNQTVSSIPGNAGYSQLVQYKQESIRCRDIKAWRESPLNTATTIGEWVKNNLDTHIN